MSTIAYARLTNAREAASPGTSSGTPPAPNAPALRTYIDAFAALVPAEVLALHAAIVAVTTTTARGAGAGTVTTIIPAAVVTLHVSFWGLLILSVVLYVMPRYSGGKEWDRYDWVRALIAPVAFVGWTMLQRATAFDAAFPGLPEIPRTVIALFLGPILGVVTAALARKADAKPAPP